MALNNSQYDTIIRAYEQKQLHNRNVLDKRYKTVYHKQFPSDYRTSKLPLLYQFNMIYIFV
mgnify:CR=1 FL=1